VVIFVSVCSEHLTSNVEARIHNVFVPAHTSLDMGNRLTGSTSFSLLASGCFNIYAN
jgi:hypothetical protein